MITLFRTKNLSLKENQYSHSSKRKAIVTLFVYLSPNNSTMKKPSKDNTRGSRSAGKPFKKDGDFKKKPHSGPKSFGASPKRKGDPLPSFSEDIRLNKYLSNAGICSRREADVLIATGVVDVNGITILEMGFKVKPGDEVRYDGALISQETKRYVLLNKPKDFITTMDDPRGRKTVMQLVHKACKERIYPVGRLDRNTTGLLMFTNDGDLAKKLTHPRYEMKKIYHVEVNKNVNFDDMQKLMSGVELDDGGFVKADKVEFIRDTKPREVGVELHSGKYRVVRRMFEAVNYEVIKLDRVLFAGLTKKDLPRGEWRHLSNDEVSFLKML
jgi:23S rRNA pseudouridine2605 synthase